MAPIKQAIDGEFDRYTARHGGEPAEGDDRHRRSFDFQLFDRGLLYSAETRFALAGIVNRMDRTYAAEQAAARSA